MMKIGKMMIDMVDTCIFRLDGGSMFGVAPKSIWSKVYDPGDELNRIPLAARPLLIQFGDKKIMIDTGNGNKMNDKLAAIYGIDKDKSSIDFALKSLNIESKDITDVILTHLHFDHTGGSTKFEDGKIVPTFPNAKYYVQKDQLNWAKNPTEKDRASYFKDDYMPLLTDGLLETVDGNGEIFPGISVIQSFGHTNAMQMIKITGDDKTLLYCADFFPTSAHIPVPYVMGYDNNPLKTIDEKKSILPQAYEEKWIIVYEHDAFIQASLINNTDKGFSAGEHIILSGK